MINTTSALIGVAISFSALAFAVLGLVLRMGRLIGTLESGILQNSKDIGKLWEHQRGQDIQISSTGKAISEINTNIEWIKETLERRPIE